MAFVETWFPTTFYIEDNVLSEKENQELKKHILKLYDEVPPGGKNWLGGTRSSLGAYDLETDSKFSKIIEKINFNVEQYADTLGSNEQYKIASGWYNVAKKHEYQEYHIHSNSIFSCVYYVSVPKKSGSISFENPNPGFYKIRDIKKPNSFNYDVAKFDAKEGRLIIFRSYVRHCVTAGMNSDPRISLSFNYVSKA